MFHVKEHADTDLPTINCTVEDDETGLVACLIRPKMESGGLMYMKRRDAKRLCNVLNGYVEETLNPRI